MPTTNATTTATTATTPWTPVRQYLTLSALCFASLGALAAAPTDAPLPDTPLPDTPQPDAPAQATQPPLEQPKQKGSVQIGISQSHLSNNNSDWRDVSVKGNVSLGETSGVLNWEASQQRHFGETGQAASVSLTRDLGPDWYTTLGVGVGASANFLTRQRLDVAVYRKWLAQRQWITGVQFTGSKSGDGQYRDQAWQLSSGYYFDFALVTELGLKHTSSNPGKVNTMRYYAAATYGENKKYYLSARYDKGREGYLPLAVAGGPVNFSSRVASATWRQWLTPNMGFELQGEHYKNPFYRRKGVGVAIFRDF